MDNDILFLVGRIILGGFFLMNAWNHFTKTDFMAGYAASKGIPSPRLAVLATGVLLLVGAAGVLLGTFVGWAVWALVIFLALVSWKMHNFWAVTDPNQKMMEQVQFMKNLALLGAALALLAVPEPWPYSLSLF